MYGTQGFSDTLTPLTNPAVAPLRCPIPQRVAEELPAEHGLRLRMHDQPESCQNICQRGLHRFRTRRELLDRAPDSPRSPRTEYLRLPRTTSPESVPVTGLRGTKAPRQ